MSIEKEIISEEIIDDYEIEIINLSKVYKIKGKKKSLKALDKINLKIKKGEIFGLLGPNGAGKTTLVSILSTLLQPTSGYATILGHNVLKEPWIIKENVGLMLGGEMIYHRLSGYRNLKFFSRLYGIKNSKKKIYEFAERFGLTKWLGQYVSTYSKGMKLKLALIRVLLIEPKILFLDEPMLGLDPKSVKEVITLLKNLNTTILLTSHQMDVVSKLCDRIGFLKKGRILKIDTQEEFKKLISDKIRIELAVLNREQNLLESLKNVDYTSEINESNKKISFYIDNKNNFSDLFNILKDYSIVHFNEIESNLEDVFIKLSE